MNVRDEWLYGESAIEGYKNSAWQGVDESLLLFVFTYMAEYNLPKSAQAAGFSTADARILIRTPLVIALIADESRDNRMVNSVTEDFVAAGWMQVYDKVMGHEEVFLIDKHGSEVMGRKFHSGEALTIMKEFQRQLDGGGGDASAAPIINVTVNPTGSKGE